MSGARGAIAWLASVIVGLGLAAGHVAAAQATSKPTCRSGKTIFRHGSTRAFFLSARNGEHQELLACRKGSGRPFALFDPGPFNAVQAERFRLVGRRLGFVIHSQGFSNGSSTTVGWADLRRRIVRLGLINAGENADPGDPLLPEDHIGYAIAADGSMALIAGSACQVVALLPVHLKADTNGSLLGPPAILFKAANGGLDATSIAVTPTAVSWRATNGASGAITLPEPQNRPPSGAC